MAQAYEQIQNDYSVEVNLCGKELNPDRVTEILDIQPAETAKRGEARHAGHTHGGYDEGFWAYESNSHDDVNECRDHQLVCLVDKIEPKIEQLRAAGVE